MSSTSRTSACALSRSRVASDRPRRPGPSAGPRSPTRGRPPSRRARCAAAPAGRRPASRCRPSPGGSSRRPGSAAWRAARRPPGRPGGRCPCVPPPRRRTRRCPRRRGRRRRTSRTARRRRLAGVQLQREVHAGLGRGLVDPLPEVAEGVLTAGVVGQLDGVEGVAEQEPAVVAQHLEHRLEPGGLQLRERGPEPGEVVRDDVAGQPGGHSARYPLPVVARRRIASARSFANRTRSGPRCSVKLRPLRVKTSCRWTPPRSRVSSSGGSGLSATGSEPLSAFRPGEPGQLVLADERAAEVAGAEQQEPVVGGVDPADDRRGELLAAGQVAVVPPLDGEVGEEPERRHEVAQQRVLVAGVLVAPAEEDPHDRPSRPRNEPRIAR